ncbi:MAG: PA0069 family radical SAM protein [Bacteroidota bacterium]
MKKPSNFLNGRGAQINTANPFSDVIYDKDPIPSLGEDRKLKTQFIDVKPKSIVNKVDSPDIPMDFSMNPYQGCEHGCVYCYARNTHTYWGYSAGLDFEQKILVKKDAPRLLESKLRSRAWKATPIMLSGNTDCYQPAEKEYELTRQMLEILLKYRHPVGIITKNSLILRDLDILKPLAEKNLVRVAISITTLNEPLRQILEPRTASVFRRLKTVQTLASHGIPVSVMMAPIIPGLNDHEILGMAEKVSSLGAYSMNYTMVRLNGDVAEIFEDWINKTMPDRAEKVMNKIRSVHGGEVKDSRFGTRMSGEGNIAEIIKSQFQLAKKKYFDNDQGPSLDTSQYEWVKNPQMKLF